jgi:hypothetical protein
MKSQTTQPVPPQVINDLLQKIAEISALLKPYLAARALEQRSEPLAKLS